METSQLKTTFILLVTLEFQQHSQYLHIEEPRLWHFVSIASKNWLCRWATKDTTLPKKYI